MIVLTLSITLGHSFTISLVCFNFYWFIWPPKYMPYIYMIAAPRWQGKNKAEQFFAQNRTRHQKLAAVLQTQLRIHCCTTSAVRISGWCVWDIPVMQRSVTVSYWPLPHLPVGSSFWWLNSFVKSTIMEISKEQAFWSLFYCLLLSN